MIISRFVRGIFSISLCLALTITATYFDQKRVNANQKALSGRTTELISVDSSGTQGNGNSGWASISGDGRYVAFWSEASNLVNGDTNTFNDIFVRDRQLGTTERVSVSSDGTQGNTDAEYWSDISSDGRYVAFSSGANNLVSGDINPWTDVFVHDRLTGETELVSIASDGSPANGSSNHPSISGDGRYVAFKSDASNLDDFPISFGDIYVHDRTTGITELVSVSSEGIHGDHSSGYPSISGDGRYVAFESDATTLVDGDTNERMDIFVHDRETDQTSRVSLTSEGTQMVSDTMRPEISNNGQYVTFLEFEGPIHYHDRITGQTITVSIHYPLSPSVSGNGRYVAYRGVVEFISKCHMWTEAIIVKDMISGLAICASISSDGESGGGGDFPKISSDGLRIAFTSGSSYLVINDENGYQDVFLHEWQGIRSVYLPLTISN